MDLKTKYIELIDDPTFSTGFNVLGYSSVDDARNIVMKIDYNGEAKPTNWFMAQWWTPYNLKDSKYLYNNKKHIYQTKSRTIEINPNDNGYLHIELLGSEEYFGKPRKSLSESWPHALIEQTFINSVKINDLQALNVHLEVSVDKCIDKNGSNFNPNIHAAQLLWYFTLKNNVSEDANYHEVGIKNDYLWFGIPIFDSRFDYLKQNSIIDQGSVGTSNKLIYTIDTRDYIKEKIKFEKTYTINIDILPYLKEVFNYAITHNALVNCKIENMEIGYMNFGWELPGMYDVASTIRNLSAKAILKNTN